MRRFALAALALLVPLAVATLVRADEEKKPDLAARCEAVDWDGPRNADHLPPGLRAIAKELTAKGPSAIAEIEEALPRSVNLRRTAPDVLSHWPCDKTRGLLLAQLADPDEQAAHHAAWGLGLVGGAEVVQPMIDAAAKPKSMVRDQVVAALGLLGAIDRGYDVIVAALGDHGYWSRLPAVQALENLNRADRLDDAIARVGELAESDPDARVKEAAQRTLRVLRAKK